MSPIDSLSSALNTLASPPLQGATKLPGALPDGLSAAPSAPVDGFSRMLDGLVSSVSGKEAQADSITSQVLLGDSSQLHQSVIAMQEASTSLSLMVAVRNKLVESYQELMRMQA
jgi:flagellar hook-basal body complex protein FliE